jgi:hypothetical protein
MWFRTIRCRWQPLLRTILFYPSSSFDFSIRGGHIFTLAMKEKALGKTKPLNGKFKRYQPGDQLLGFLNNL